MKSAPFLFSLIIAAALLQGTGLAAQASPAPQPAISRSKEKSADQHTEEIGNEKDQARTTETDEKQAQPADVTRTATEHRASALHSIPLPSHHARPAKTLTKNSTRTNASGSVASMGSKEATSIPSKMVNRRSPVPSSAVSVNGQQFKNARDPGARLALSGGLTAPKGTAEINGTNMKRRP